MSEGRRTGTTSGSPTAAGDLTRRLRVGRRRCAALTWRHGTTYFWGAMLLPTGQRRDVFSVYALCRLADDIVDEPPAGSDPIAGLAAFRTAFERSAFDGEPTDDPVLTAVADTVRRRRIDRDCFDRFFDAMALDHDVEAWPSWPALRDGYMEGSAAVIGEMMLPVLEPRSPEAYGPARSLGLAFQLTNFIRDVDEDLDRGRVYLPADDLARHGADPRRRVADPAWRTFLAEQIERNRELFRDAERGVALLPPASARCVATALTLYEGILDRIVAADYDVFAGRIRVPLPIKVGVALRSLLTRRPSVGPRVPSIEPTGEGRR